MIFSISGIHFNIFEIVLLLSLLIFIPGVFAHFGSRIHVKSSKSFNIIICSFTLYISFILMSYFAASNELRVIKGFLKWLEIFIFSILIFLYIHNFKNFKKIYWILWISNFSLIIFVLFSIMFNNVRIFEYRIFPGYASAIALALLLPFVNRKNKSAVILSIMCFISAFLSLSRGVWIILLIYLILIIKNISLKKRILALGLSFIIGWGLFLYTPIGELIMFRIHGTKASHIERIGMAKMALQAFRSSPIIGIGSLNFPNYLISNANNFIIRSEEPEKLEPHNIILQIAAEEGIFALLAFVTMILTLYCVIFKTSKTLIVFKDFLPYLNGLKYLTIPITLNILFGIIADHFRFIFCLFIGLSLSILRLSIFESTIRNKNNT